MGCTLSWGGATVKSIFLSKDIVQLIVIKDKQKSLLKRQSHLRKDITKKLQIKSIANVINSNIKKHKVAKITSISLLALSLVALISSATILIPTSLLGVGLISAIATRYFSKKIESAYQQISNSQKKRKLHCNYKLYFNKLFYMKIKAPG